MSVALKVGILAGRCVNIFSCLARRTVGLGSAQSAATTLTLRPRPPRRTVRPSLAYQAQSRRASEKGLNIVLCSAAFVVIFCNKRVCPPLIGKSHRRKNTASAEKKRGEERKRKIKKRKHGVKASEVKRKKNTVKRNGAAITLRPAIAIIYGTVRVLGRHL